MLTEAPLRALLFPIAVCAVLSAFLGAVKKN